MHSFNVVFYKCVLLCIKKGENHLKGLQFFFLTGGALQVDLSPFTPQCLKAEQKATLELVLSSIDMDILPGQYI